MMDEIGLIQAAREGKLEAFNELVLKYQEAIYNHAYWMLHDEDAAEDITQDTFIRAYHHIRNCRPETFRAWLLRISTNLCIDLLRQQRRRATLPLSEIDDPENDFESAGWLSDNSPSVEERIEQDEWNEEFMRCFYALNERDRAILLLSDMHTLNLKEIGAALDLPIGTVKSRISRARAHLRNRIQACAPEIRWQPAYSTI